MAYTARELIQRSWYLSAVVVSGLETVGGADDTEGLNLLNDLLAFKSTDLPLIPYYRPYEFELEVGEPEYFIENLLSVDTLNFLLGPVHFSSVQQSRIDYYRGGRIDNINSLPFSWYQERTKGGTNLFFYFSPADTYTVQLVGKFGLDSATLETDLSLIYDGLYLVYLMFALAEYMCAWKGVDFTQDKRDKLNELVKKLQYLSAPDLRVNKVSILDTNDYYNYADASFRNAWRADVW